MMKYRSQILTASKRISHYFFICICIFLIGCSTTWNVAPEKPLVLATNQFDLQVRLVLSQELLDAKWQGKVDPFTTVQIPLGAALAAHSEHMARALFRDVTVLRPGHNSVNGDNNDVVLTSKIVSAERTQPTTIYGQQTTTVIVEWTLLDSKGRAVWIDTITGQGQSKMGLYPEKNAELQFSAAFEQLFKNCYESILSSDEIKQIAGKLK